MSTFVLHIGLFVRIKRLPCSTSCERNASPYISLSFYLSSSHTCTHRYHWIAIRHIIIIWNVIRLEKKTIKIKGKNYLLSDETSNPSEMRRRATAWVQNALDFVTTFECRIQHTRHTSIELWKMTRSKWMHSCVTKQWRAMHKKSQRVVRYKLPTSDRILKFWLFY